MKNIKLNNIYLGANSITLTYSGITAMNQDEADSELRAISKTLEHSSKMLAELERMIDVLSVLKIQSDREGWSNGVYLKLQIDILGELVKKAKGIQWKS